MKEAKNVIAEHETANGTGVSRRRFLGYAGGLAGAGLLIASCGKDNTVAPEAGATDLGVNDEGLINLMFVSQQVEAAFYTQVLLTPYSGMNPTEKLLLTDMRDHEIAHREFLRNYLKGKGTSVQTDFSSVNFDNKANVLENAEMIENLVVALNNEIGRLLVFSDNAAIVVKLATVEARHAGTISNFRNTGSFFGPVDVTGSEPGMLPSNAVTTLNRFLSTKVSGNNLPNK
ncbi:MAG: ferritin-like domain-containing protein [Chitinophagaceae bacterium]|nr:ferritin-like domain-containing protein [Chitinophagaceae bacterium]MCB9044922.1 ferritin-like domain-containing protein [Chitinophagales bacterium]